jgi:type IV pilus assembly protein PilC
MSNYKYTAKNPSSGKQTKSSLDAQSEKDAAQAIKDSGLIPIEIKAESSGSLMAFNLKNHIKTKDKVLFSRQLSTLINAGLPMSQSLRSVADQTSSKPLKLIVNSIVSDVEGGLSLSASMAKYPKVFSQVVLSLVQSGESSGTLDKALDRIALQLEKDADIVSKVRGAMIYPIIVFLVMIAVVTFMLVKVLPQVNVLYVAFPGATLPIETRLLLGLSKLLITYWWAFIIAFGLIIYFGMRWIKTDNGRLFFDKFKLRAPPFGKLFQKIYMARFSRTASTLVGAGVPLLQVLQITSEAVSNVLVSSSILRASEKVKLGKSLSSSLEGDPNFLPLVPNMLHIGEASGSMEAMLAKTADYFEKEVDDEIKNISTLIEPIMMVILGIVALIIVAAVLLPVYGLASSGAVSGGGQ